LQTVRPWETGYWEAADALQCIPTKPARACGSKPLQIAAEGADFLLAGEEPG
jgi:hypothetical protein